MPMTRGAYDGQQGTYGETIAHNKPLWKRMEAKVKFAKVQSDTDKRRAKQSVCAGRPCIRGGGKVLYMHLGMEAPVKA